MPLPSPAWPDPAQPVAPPFALQLPWGVCHGVVVGEAAHGASLTAAERTRLRTLGPALQRTWPAGRAALRQALDAHAAPTGDLLTNHRGAPQLPPGWVGSIAHKEQLAVAMAARAAGAHLGIDVECWQPARPLIASRVLTPHELAQVGTLPETERWTATLLRFALKEAIYKAVDPTLQRYVGFHEVEVQPRPDGAVEVAMAWREPAPLELQARWFSWSAGVVAVARCQG